MKDRASSDARPEKEDLDNTFFLPGSINKLLFSLPEEAPDFGKMACDCQAQSVSPSGVPSFPLENCPSLHPVPSCGAIGRSPDSYIQPETASRLIKTNWCDDVKSYNFAIYRFKEYIRKREEWYIQIHGKVKLTQTGFTFKKTDVHRWKDGYLKKRLARLYKLRDWFEEQPSQDVTMITLTVPHNVNIWGKTVNNGHNIYQAWKNLKQGWARLRHCQIFKNRDFVIFYEPHKSGYSHSHLMVYGVPFTEEEEMHLKELWNEFTGADLLKGVEVRAGVGVEHLIAYLMKYTSKTYYHTMSEWTRGEWLFNAIAHEGRYRLFGSSNNLAKVMRLSTDSDDSVETLDVSLHGLNPRDNDDSVCSSRLWTNPEKKSEKMKLVDFPSIPTSERVSRWKLKTDFIESESEIKFKAKQEEWRIFILQCEDQREWTKKRREGIWGPDGPPVPS